MKNFLLDVISPGAIIATSPITWIIVGVLVVLAVVGIAGSISPITDYSPYVLTRDVPTLIGATLSIMIFGINWRRPRAAGSVNRIEGALWILSFVAYTALMIIQEVK